MTSVRELIAIDLLPAPFDVLRGYQRGATVLDVANRKFIEAGGGVMVADGLIGSFTMTDFLWFEILFARPGGIILFNQIRYTSPTWVRFCAGGLLEDQFVDVCRSPVPRPIFFWAAELGSYNWDYWYGL